MHPIEKRVILTAIATATPSKKFFDDISRENVDTPEVGPDGLKLGGRSQ